MCNFYGSFEKISTNGVPLCSATTAEKYNNTSRMLVNLF